MGNKFTIYAWGKHGSEDYFDMQVWGGESAIKALIAFIKLKRRGDYGCITLSWR